MEIFIENLMEIRTFHGKDFYEERLLTLLLKNSKIYIKIEFLEIIQKCFSFSFGCVSFLTSSSRYHLTIILFLCFFRYDISHAFNYDERDHNFIIPCI
jgi:hypothetical protein